MKKISIFVLILFLCSLCFMYGKSTPKYVKMMKDKKVNFFDVKKEAEKYFKGKDKGKGSGWKQYKRWEDHWGKRLFPTGDRDNLADPVQEMSEFFASSGAADAFAQAGSWVSLGPTDYQDITGHWSPGLGRINVIMMDPNNSNIIYVGSPSGGLWRTTTGGNSWTALTDGIEGMGVSCILIDPSDSDIIYIGTGDKDHRDTWSRGVLKSTDGGATWNTTGLTFVPTDWQSIHKMVMHPTNSSILFAGTYDGLYKSTNAAASWTKVADGDFDDLEFKPGDPTVMYAATNEVPSPTFYRSTNTGDSWSSTSMTSTNRAQIAVTPANSSYVYYYSASGGLYRSTNSGVSFSKTGNAPTPGTQDWYDLSLAVSPTNANEVHVGEIETWVSFNAGSSWTKTSIWYIPNSTGYIHCDIHEMAYFGNTLFIGSDGLITKTTDSASSFTDLSVGLGIRQFYRMGSGVIGNGYKLVGGSQDNGTSVYSTNYWHEWLGADGMECAINYNNENIIYGCIQNGQFYKSNNGGANEVSISQPGGGDWVTPYVMHPTNPDTIFVGNNYVRKTTNGMSSWSTIGNFGSGNINAIAVAKSDANYIYAAKDERIWRTTNGGSSWTEITGTLPSYFVTYISVHPSNPQKIAVTLSSTYTYADGEKVFISSNAGTNWTNYSANLPNLPALCVAYHGGANDAMYVGMDIGVYYRDNTMGNWLAFFDGLPNVVVKELEIDDNIGKIRAATYGRGLWESDLYGGTPPGGYCTASHNTQNEMITRIQVGTIDKSSGWATYSDFTSESTDMEIGTGYPFTASVNYSWESGSKFGIWIDWNRDEDFEDAGEEVYTYSGVGPYSTTITPPTGASLGTTRMRVRMFWQVTPTPCGDLVSGEVEDYTVNIIPAGQQPPVADFSGSPTTVTAGGNVAFTDLSTNSPTSWSWTFSGGTPSSSTEQNPTITYNTAGNYTVELQATNAAGSDTETKTGYITVNAPPPPVADFTASETTIYEGESVDFTDLTTNNPYSWSWTFNGGTPSSSTLQNPTVTYNTAGTYTVELFATAPGGSDTETKTDYITVNVQPETAEVGYTTVFGSSTTTANRRAMPFTMPENGTIQSVSMYHTGGSGNMILGVYDASGSPQYRIGVTPSTPVSGSTGWQTIDLTSPVFVSGGTTIWLAWVYQSNPGIRYQTGSPGRYDAGVGWSGGMPDPFGSSTQANYIYSIYATYTPGGNPPQYTLTTNTVGQGSVTLDPAGGTYDQGTIVTVTADPDSGWQFDSWSGDLSGSTNPTTITMNGNKNVTATFTEIGTTGEVGITSVYSSTSTSANRRAMPFTMPENGTITSVTMYHTGGSGNMILAVYDGSSTPQNRLAVTPSTAVSGSTGWQTINLTSPVFVSGGSPIWLAWVYQSNPGIRYQTGSPGRFQSSQTWSGGMPDPFGSGSQSSYRYSIYATYTIGGGSPAALPGENFTIRTDGGQLLIEHPAYEGSLIISIYNAKGDFVQKIMHNGGKTKKVNISSLPAGKYSAVLDNGRQTVKKNFVKN